MIHGYLGPQDWFPLSVAADRSILLVVGSLPASCSVELVFQETFIRHALKD
jgi:hypothetical protein